MFMLLSGIYLGFVIPKQQRAKREAAAIIAIEGSVGGELLYDYQLDGGKDNPVPRWIQAVFGEHTFATVKRISLGKKDIAFGLAKLRGPSGDLATKLKAFRDVEVLHAGNCFVDMENLGCLSKMKKLRELRIDSANSLNSLRGLENCRQLSSLEMNNISAESFAALGELSRLSELSISRCFHVESLDFLASFKNLKSLSLTHTTNGIDAFCFDFELIQQNNGLRELRIGSFDELASTQVLGRFSNLESFQLEHSDYEFDLSMFAPNASTLQKLRLRCCHGIRTLDGIESFGELEELEINWCSGLTDLDAIANHPKLKSLTIKNMPLDRLPRLKNLPELELLGFHKMMKVKNVDGLASLRASKLRQLVFDDCIELADVKGLESLLAFEAIEFKACHLVEDADIKGMKDQFPSSEITRRDRH